MFITTHIFRVTYFRLNAQSYMFKCKPKIPKIKEYANENLNKKLYCCFKKY